MEGAFIPLFPRGKFHDLAEIHPRHSVTDMPYYIQVMSDKEIGDMILFLQLFQKVADLGLDGHIQCRNRLIRDNQFWLQRDGPCDPNPLSLSAAELMRVSPHHIGIKPHPL